MITAKEARKITKESKIALELVLEQIGEKVEAASNNGEYSLNLSKAFISRDEFQVVEPSSGFSTVKPKLTEFQRLLEAELHCRGYGFTLKSYTYKEGGGLGALTDDDDTPRKTKLGYHLVINW